MSHRRFIKKLISDDSTPEIRDKPAPILSRKVKEVKHNTQPKKPAEISEYIPRDDSIPLFNLKIDQPISSYNVLDLPNPNYEPPLKHISAVNFNFLTAQDIENMSVANINLSKFSGENSIYDPRMGLISNFQKCMTCNMQWNCCPGHPGSINLPIPLPHPLRLKQLADMLTCVCEYCHRLVLSKEQLYTLGIAKYRGEHRFHAFLREAKKIAKCSHCNKPHGKYMMIDDKFFKLYKRASEIKKFPVTYDEIIDIVSNTRQVDFELLGFSNSICHPNNMIMRNLYVLPSCDRFPIEGAGVLMHDDLTHKYIEIIKIVNKLKEADVGEKIRGDLMDMLTFHIKTMLDNSKNKARDIGGRRSIRCLKRRLTGKMGHPRQHLQGKRGNSCARSVISPDPDLHVNRVGFPKDIADKLTYPERVNDINITWLQHLVDTNQTIRIKRGTGWAVSKHLLYTPGFKLKYGDKIIRGNKTLNPATLENFTLQEGDTVTRIMEIEDETGTLHREQLTFPNVAIPKRKPFTLQKGDIVERKLQNGDWTLFNRQPSLHAPSLRAKQIEIHRDRTFKLDLASTAAYNADFDGDEMNAFIAQYVESVAEMKHLMSTEAQFISAADSKPILSLKQDAMTMGYICTLGKVPIEKDTFNDCCCKTDWTLDYICSKKAHIKKVYQRTGLYKDEVQRLTELAANLDNAIGNIKVEIAKIEKQLGKKNIRTKQHKLDLQNLQTKLNYLISDSKLYHNIELLAEDNLLYTGYSLISMLFPSNFDYICDNKISPDKKPVRIIHGVMISGTLNKVALGNSSGSLLHHLTKDYGAEFAGDFVTYYQRFMNLLVGQHGFSIGLEDCIPKKTQIIQTELEKCFLQSAKILESEHDPEICEAKLHALLNQATDLGDRIAKDALKEDNNFMRTIISGAKGSLFNITHITSCIGQQNVEGKRIAQNCSGRTLPSYSKIKSTDNIKQLEKLFQSRGFILSSFYAGLEPEEFFFLSAGGREGLTDSSVKTAKCGYLSRRLLKLLEDIKISYAGMVVNSKNSIVQFTYGNDNFAGDELIKTEKYGYQVSDVEHMVNMLNGEYEYAHDI